MPKISVIVPIYNVEKYLHRCVDSILNQTFINFECILVDDGSPDRCPQICDEYARKDNRIKVIHKPNGGLSDARNAGIDIAQGEYLSFIDSDDWIHPQMLEILYDGIVKNNVLMSVCAYEQVEKENSFEKIENPIFKIYNGMQFLMTSGITGIVVWNKIFHKSLFSVARFPVGRIHEDEFITYKLLYNAENIVFCSEKLYMYFVNHEGVTKSGFSAKKMEDAFLALEEKLRFFKTKRDEKLCIYAEESLFFLTCKYYYEINNDGNYRKCSKFLTNKMRKYLFLYSRKINANIKKDPCYYEIAFPKFMRIYWIFSISKQKIATEGIIKTVKKGVRNVKKSRHMGTQ